MKQQITRLLAVVALLIVIASVYLPGLSGPFVLDDFENITLNPSVAMHTLDATSIRVAAQGNESGLLGRPLPSVSFALNYYWAGGANSTLPFKVTNLAIHLCNTVLVLILCLALLGSPAGQRAIRQEHRFIAAFFATALWALHPIQITNVLYVVQRINSLAAFWVLSGLILYVVGRTQLTARPRKGLLLMSAGAVAGLIIGLLCKENAILWPLFALAIEATLFEQTNDTRSTRNRVIAFHAIVFGTLACIGILYSESLLEVLHRSYLGRPFSPLERVLSETRIIWHYIFAILVPSPNQFGLFHDDIVLSTAFTKPITTLPALITVAGLTVAAISQRRRYPIAAFSVLWFFIGHSLESGFIGLELAYEYRNYLPSFGLLFGVSVLILQAAENHRRYAYAAHIFLAAFITLSAVVTLDWSRIWKDNATLATELARCHPASPRANEFAATTSFDSGNLKAALRYSLRSIDLLPNEAGLHLDLQLVLAAIAWQLEHNPKAYNTLASAKGTSLRIPGIDEQFQISRNASGTKIVYPQSLHRLPELLSHEPITVYTITGIERLRECLVTPPYICAPLEKEALKWFTIAADNANAARDYRAIIAADVAALYAQRKEYRQALEYMTRASRELPNMPSYRLTLAEYMVQLCRIDQAAALVDTFQFRKESANDRLMRQRLQTLSLEIARRRQEARCNASAP